MMADDSIPPRPECESDFNLPLSIDNKDGGNLDQGTSEDPVEYLFNNTEPHPNLDVDDQNNAQQPMNYDTVAQDFSDDVNSKEAFDRSWTAQQARKPSPTKKKSPRCSDDSIGDDEASLRTKRPRKSMFGGSTEDTEDNKREDYVDCQIEGLNAPKTSGQGIRYGMSSLNLDQQDAQEDCPTNTGFGIGYFDRDSLSPVSSRAPSEESVIIPPDDRPVYELRQNIDRAKLFTYIDTDQTGNYDPSQEAKSKTLRFKKAKAAKAAKAAKKKGKGKEKARKEHVKKCIVKFRFKAFGNVRNHTNDEDNWPEDWSEVGSHYERDVKDITDFYRRNTPDLDAQISIEDPSGDVDDLTGYPAARGCRHCRKHEKNCSMIGGGTYPCEECEDDDIDCEPILETTINGRCKQCAEYGQEMCSFEEEPDQAICDHCRENEFICEALPPRGYKIPRISINEIMYGPNRKHIQCTFCRSEKKKCSMEKKTDKPPCKYCKKHGIGCTFYDLPKTTAERKLTAMQEAALGPTYGVAPEVSKPGPGFFSTEDLEDMMKNEEETFFRVATPEIEMEDEAGNKGMLTKIKTSFAHPMKFNAEVKEAFDCNFCEMPMFGMVGYLEREVYVIRWYSGLGYTETGGGYCENNGPSTMCTNCTLARLQVIVCPYHELQSISDDVAAQNFEDVTGALISAEPGSSEIIYQLQRWCSMCFSVASFGCATVQPSLTGEDNAEVVGCGLRLCNKCAEILRDKYYLNLEEMAAEMDKKTPKVSEEDEQSGNLAGKARADVGFLSSTGLMMRVVNAGEGDDEMTCDV